MMVWHCRTVCGLTLTVTTTYAVIYLQARELIAVSTVTPGMLGQCQNQWELLNAGSSCT